uniref:Tail protein n=1 Tax=viral metagenome TaxID=1070528 RepID=A0A6M3J4A5_9ZZZZ
MAQTTGAMSGVNVAVYYSNDGTNFTDISGSVSSVTPSGFNRQSGEVYSFDGDHAIIGKGKREPLEVEVNTVYSELAGEAFVVAWTEFDADDGDSFWFRWVNTSGGSTYTTDTGVLLSLLPPSGEAAPGDPLVASATLKCAQVNKT